MGKPGKHSVKPTAAKSASLPAASTVATRHFEFVEGGSAKFWEISVSGNDVTVRFGRLGTQGQTQTKSFSDAEATARHAEKLIGEKMKKGYVETANEG